MAPPTTLGFSLAASLSWGTSDFIGGYAVRSANAFLFTAIAHGCGALLITGVALLSHSPWPAHASVLWAAVAGLSGGAALAVFYRALADGGMGMAAPVAGVLAAAIPAGVGLATEGFPGVTPVLGFVLAALGIWLISRSEDGAPVRGLGSALLAGLGFAGFFLCAKQAGTGSALWIAVVARLGSFAITAVIVLLTGARTIAGKGVALGAFAGCLDIAGSVAFLRATQTGRLDVTVVMTSLYPAVTVLLARLILREHLSHWKLAGVVLSLLAIPLIALP